MATRRGGGRPGWILDPHSGGVRIPVPMQHKVERRLRAHAEKHYAGRYARLDIRFRGAFCYVDAYREPDKKARPLLGSRETVEQLRARLRNTPIHLCRLHHYGQDEWSLAFFVYSDERYTPCVFRSGSFLGTPEDGVDVGATCLRA